MMILDKIFTREFPLLLNQLWGRSYEYHFSDKLNLYPIQVFIMKDGMTTVYRNPGLYNSINKEYTKELKSNKNYFKDLYNESLVQFDELEKMWDKEYLNKEELLYFYKKLTKLWLGIYSSVYVPKYPKLFSDEDRDLFIDLRSKIDVAADKGTDIMLKSLVQEYKISQEQAYYISYEDLLKDVIDSDKLNNLIINDLYIIDGNIISKEIFDLEKNKNSFDLEKIETSSGSIIHGSIAQKGVVTGRVKLLMKRSDIDEVKEGEILVTYMTIPDYIPAMKRAAAFVTDEGGITCHAAIIAREMKKPCVIGTRFATKVLKDGDLVEVDADNGIINMLKK